MLRSRRAQGVIVRSRTKHIKALIGVMAIAALVSACGPRPSAGPGSCGPDDVTGAVFNRINADRAAYGLGPLSWSGQLGCLASDWSNHMASTGVMSHRDLSAVLGWPGYEGWHTLGENVLEGPPGTTADQMEDAWMASSDHRANILSGAYSYVGVGFAVSGDGQVWATENFGG
jgi:uncharacterized protein YkwD